MKTRILDIPHKMDFKDIMEYHDFKGVIPSNKIINKCVPGIGATYNEIMAKRHSIIIAPFTAIIEVKKLRHGNDLCVVYGEYDQEQAFIDVLTYLNDDKIPYKKIMTTPESFYKVKRALLDHNPNYTNEYFILIDECDVLVHDALFRKNILLIMPEFFAFKNKAMISATPLIPSDPRFDSEDFEYIILEPKYKFKQKLNLIATNNINSSVRDIIKLLNLKGDNPFLIFTNCKTTIAYISQLEMVKADYRIYCNDSLDQSYFKPHNIEHVYDSVVKQEYAKYNFFTSRFFSGVDFLLPEEKQPHVIMISNVINTPHSIISPTVTAVQIFGRSRRGVKSTTHITNIHKGIKTLNKQDIIDKIDKKLYHISELQKLERSSYDNNTKKMIRDIADKSHENIVFNSDGTVNPYFRDNFLVSTIAHNLYSDENVLLNEYKEGNFFNVQLQTTHKALKLLYLSRQRVKRITYLNSNYVPRKKSIR